ncbi:hypothetical protein ESA94_11095 [Lacibacter luteus]|uniref:Uncharacterized protein n=1 Tax=Lacibacter luteus TaxID=2508719 RepID=A0A4Q1CK13_9BACT|nr:hypothetical protein [Lacibacter luteus]RXK60989.1 hypothetical protein ESA94_11095 [Lacibacter luteus]
MAQQKGILPLKGTIGNITFYKSKDGYLAREKTSVNAERIANDPAFARTRENGAEFGRAGAAGKVLRTALRSLLLHTADSRMLSRLTREMMKVIQADATNERGLRNVIDGEAELLEGFEFNASSKLGTSLFAPYSASIDRVSGALAIAIPPFVPMNMVAAPSGATHFKLVSAGVEVDFENKTYVVDFGDSNSLPINSTATAALNLNHQVTANSTKPLFLVLGIEFYQEVNGNQYSLKNGAFNALALVKVSGA